ncbi:MAG TPA: hypothetical protein DCP79_05955 [Prevotella sp.]|nr:DUF3127 domain-containing protein [Prevotella sp.]MBD9201522.1 DUF3127 domain-containing protein [Prevotella sp.]HAM29397.1 hypothetical protein [Prevotella sp.]
MEITGKITYVLPERSGTSARGEWKAQSFVVETEDNYPRKMVFDVFGAERLQTFNIKVGDKVKVSFDIDAHEYQGRWFNNIRAYDVLHLDAAAAQAAGQAAAAAPQTTQAAPAPFPPAQPDAAGESTDDLPF